MRTLINLINFLWHTLFLPHYPYSQLDKNYELVIKNFHLSESTITEKPIELPSPDTIPDCAEKTKFY